MPGTPTRPARCRRCTKRYSSRPSARRPPTITASFIAISPVARWRRKASMAPDADAGKSSKRSDPFAPLTSEQLVVGDGHDIYVESIGRLGGIPAVYLHGGPDRVTGVVLRATFLGTIKEIENGFLSVLPRFYPGLYEDFLSVLPAEERAQPIDAYFRRILDPDSAVHVPAARAWGETESILSE